MAYEEASSPSREEFRVSSPTVGAHDANGNVDVVYGGGPSIPTVVPSIETSDTDDFDMVDDFDDDGSENGGKAAAAQKNVTTPNFNDEAMASSPTATLQPITPSVAPNLVMTTPTGNKTKRKAPRAYSTNPNTMRVRQRNASLTPYQLAVERARGNDYKAVSTAWRERTNSESFQGSTPDVRRAILADVEKSVMERRRKKGIDANSKIFSLNQALWQAQQARIARAAGIFGTNGGAAGGNGGSNGGNAGDTQRQDALTRLGGDVEQNAPPGYVPFPTIEPIECLMDNGGKKKTAVEKAAAQLGADISGYSLISPPPTATAASFAINSSPTVAGGSSFASSASAAGPVFARASNEELKGKIDQLLDIAQKHSDEWMFQRAEIQELKIKVGELKRNVQNFSGMMQMMQYIRGPQPQLQPQSQQVPGYDVPTTPGYPPLQHHQENFYNSSPNNVSMGGSYNTSGFSSFQDGEY
ncbi:hypothetical protein F4808DRAFT_367283 [Astrocystis sublimbata]|nr:hypothetical protein F4808DRAFT_367283 [Astrocystis sublimbata]